MSAGERSLALVASELRATFDSAFARAHAPEPPLELDLLEIHVAEHAYALRLAHVSAVHADRRVVPVPGPRPELLGLVGVRGAVAPVYDLRLLLGYRNSAPPRFVAEVRAGAPFAVAFERLERHLRVAASDVTVAAPDGAFEHEFVPGSVRTATGLLPLIDLLAIFRAVTRRPSAPEREERA